LTAVDRWKKAKRFSHRHTRTHTDGDWETGRKGKRETEKEYDGGGESANRGKGVENKG
jgi:hypothetical protein